MYTDDFKTYKQTFVADSSIYECEWFVDSHRIDSLSFHEFMMKK
ncbi:hypothetical protein FHQ18_06985 [Deferribacter autotrophicus]|uniref:Calcium/calmodulin-dependent protein kinase II association-domain domain-containing protein n=1 Tax=Deferribacter autotrophicus TaxID=500465 RepID=A0A5A8F2U1_9BACT|nr:hypothetical protein FHQ18_06985 [Deferribacter autotrophicus]